MSAGVVVADLYASLSAPQGDIGNAVVLRARARARGIPLDVVIVDAQDPLPRADVYLLGGTEELEQPVLVERLRAGGLASAVAAGAAVLAVDAGFQVLGESFDGLDGRRHDGVGLVDVRSRLGDVALGPVITRPNEQLGLPSMSAYESHRGRTDLGAGLAPLAHLELGTGNGGEPATDGAVDGRVVGTYLHGPLLARNPALADLLLGRATGQVLPLLELDEERDLRRERLVAAGLGALADDDDRTARAEDPQP